ncbi:MAG TPA: flagellar biosynthetic protein FliR [Terriglobales bacterium]|nr:flagellar biosynthetic protein FliR [Terriglobales bacterium]
MTLALTNWLRYLIPGLLIATRLSGVMLTGPFWGASAIPARIKAGLVIAFTAVLLPVAGPALPSNSLLDLFGYGLSELMIGVLLGLAVLIVMEAAQLAGNVAGFQLGLGLETAFDPTTQADTTVLATFHQLMVLYLMLQLGVHRWVLRALAESFTTLPLGSNLSALTARQLLEFAGNLWVWGLQLVLPVLMVTMLIDVTEGFFAKAAPQLPVMFIGIPVKALCGYAVLMAAVSFWPGIFSRHFQQAVNFFLQHAHAGAAVTG